MKVGDLVKYKWITISQKRRAKQFGCRADSVGVIVDIISESGARGGKYNQLLVRFVGMPESIQATQFNLEKVVE